MKSILIFFLLLSSIKSPPINIGVDLPENIVICEPGGCVNLNSIITGGNQCFFWTSDLGYFNDFDLNPTVCVQNEENFILTAIGFDLGPNLIINGDFESGSSSFYTDYAFEPCGNNSFGVLGCEGSYTIGTDASTTHTNFSACGSPGLGGNYMILNGSTSSANVFCQTVTVNPNSKYQVSVWGQSVINSSPATLQFSINGSVLPSATTLGGACSPSFMVDTWNSGASSSALVCVQNLNNAASGNDFGIDDVMFAEFCSDTAHIRVTVDPFTLDGSIPDLINCYVPTEDLTVYPNPPGNYSYNWYSFDGNIISQNGLQTITVDQPGVYTVDVINDQGCIESLDFYVSGSLDKPEVILNIPDSLDCKQNLIEITHNANDPDFFYNWTGPGITTNGNQASILVNTPGLYILEVINTYSGCNELFSIEVFENLELPASSIASLDTLNCSILEDSIYFNSLDPSANITWEDPMGNLFMQDTLITSISGIYEAYLTYPNANCLDTLETELYIDTLAPSFQIIASNNLDCTNPNAVLSGMVDPNIVSYQWSGPNVINESNIDLEITEGGNFTLEVIYKNGCTASSEINIEQHIPIFNFTLEGDTIINCEKDSSVLQSNLLDNNISIDWLTPNGIISSEEDITVFIPGWYTLMLTDSVGCVTSDSIYIVQDIDEANYTLIPDTLSCTKNLGTLTAFSDDPNAIISWIDPLGNNFSGNVLMTDIIGDYSVIIEYPNGCKSFSNVSLEISESFPQLSVDGNLHINCLDTEAILTGFSSIPVGQEQWLDPMGNNTSGNMIVGLDAGSYTYAVTTTDGCEAEYNVMVTLDTTKPELVLLPDLELNCIKTLAENTYSSSSDIAHVEWIYIPTAEVISNADIFTTDQPGDYTLLLYGENGCVTAFDFTIISDENPPDFQITFDSIDCDNPIATIELFSNENLEFNLTDPLGNVQQGNVFSTDMGGTIEIEAISENGCRSLRSVEIIVDTISPSVNLTLGTLNCLVDSFDPQVITSSDVISQQWSSAGGFNSTEVAPTLNQADIYTIQVAAANGCTSIANAELFIDTMVTLPVLTAGTLNCGINSVTVENINNANYTAYEWMDENGNSSNDSSFAASEAGQVTLTVTVANGCTAEESIQIEDLSDELTVLLAKDRDILTCLEDNTNLSVVNLPNMATVNWILLGNVVSTEPIFNTKFPGNYTAEVTDMNGCDGSESIEVLIDTIAPIFQFEAESITCSRPIARISIINPDPFIDYSFYDGNNLITSGSFTLWSEASLITIEAIGTNGCSSVQTHQIEIDTSNINFQLETDIITCDRPSVDIRLSEIFEGFVHEWFFDGNLVSSESDPLTVSEAGLYTLLISNPINGCSREKTIEVTEIDEAPVNIEYDIIQPLCGETDFLIRDIIIEGGIPPFSYSIGNSDFIAFDQLPILTAGSHELVIKDSNGCTLMTSFELSIPDPLTSYIIPELEVNWNIDHEMFLTINKPLNEIVSIEWFPKSGLSCYDCIDPIANLTEDTEYEILIEDIDGCTSRASIKISVLKNIQIYTPNAFTPFNGDGINDKFRLFGLPKDVKIVSTMSIYDRWGNLVFEQFDKLIDDPDFGWNGRKHERKLAPGVYVFVAEVIFKDETETLLFGDVTLID